MSENGTQPVTISISHADAEWLDRLLASEKAEAEKLTDESNLAASRISAAIQKRID